MSGLDGVNRGPRPLRPGSARGAKKSEKSAENKEAGSEFSVESGGSPEAVVGKAGVGPRFSSLRERILQGVDGDESKEQILRRVVDDEVRNSFGNNASDKMVDSIAQAFDENEQLRALFNRLYGEALRGRETR